MQTERNSFFSPAPIAAEDFWRMPNWYTQLAAHTFITTFVPLPKDAIELLKEGELRRGALKDLFHGVTGAVKASDLP